MRQTVGMHIAVREGQANTHSCHSYQKRLTESSEEKEERSEGMRRVLSLLVLLCSRAWALIDTVVFKAGQFGYHTFRIPAVIQTPTSLLLFAEGRKLDIRRRCIAVTVSAGSLHTPPSVRPYSGHCQCCHCCLDHCKRR